MKINLLSVILAAAVIVLILLNMGTCNKLVRTGDLYDATQDSLRKSFDTMGREYAIIKDLQATNKEGLLNLKTKDTTIQWLQSVVKDYEGKLAASIVTSTQTSVGGGSSTTITATDTEIRNDSIFLFPTYETDWDGKWDRGWIKATRDSIFYDLKVKNELEIVIGEPSKGLFKKSVSEVQVKNLNPNTATQELRSFTLEHTQKKLGIGVQVGYGFTISNPVHISPYIGIGLDYRIFSIK